MRQEIQTYLDANPDIKYFVRAHPTWYRRLRRTPNTVHSLRKAADEYYGRTLPKKIERVGEQLNMILMMIQMAKLLGNENESDNSELQDD